jgi:hypothetical protein
MRLVFTCLFLLVPIYSAVAKNATYNNPRYYSNGLPIDYCLFPTKQCGQPAADKFCKDMNAGSAMSFKAGRSNSPTYIQGSGDTCNKNKYDHCDALTQIVCGSYTL